MQWSFLTEGKQKNELAQKEFRFIIIIMRAAAITRCASLPRPRCTGAKDGKLQYGHSKQTYAVECFD
jgi:hypothetical protein